MKLDIKKMQTFMLRKCWSIADLQRQAGLAGNTLYKICDGTNNASMRTLGKIAKALEVDPMEIIKEGEN